MLNVGEVFSCYFTDLHEIFVEINEEKLEGPNVTIFNDFVLPRTFISSDRQLLNNAELNPDLNYLELSYKTSSYIEVCKLDEFFNFQNKSSLNIMHIICRSIKKHSVILQLCSVL